MRINFSNFYLVIALMLIMLLLTACGPAATSGPTAIPIEDLVSPTETQVEPVAPAEPEEIADAEKAEETEPAEEVESAAAPDANCVACHTDKDRLVDTADPVVEIVSENEGSG